MQTFVGNYLWASALQTIIKAEKETLYRKRNQWVKRDRLFAPAMGVLFVQGTVSSLTYGALRVLSK
jgi:hypothetical protein